MATEQRGSMGLRRALGLRFLGWVGVLLASELVVGGFESMAIAPLLAAAVRRDYELGSALGLGGALRWALAVMWGILSSRGAASPGLWGTSAAMLIVSLMVVLVVAPVVLVTRAFARQAEGLLSAELRARDDELRQAYERRNLMISDMAHDLRTPVMGISGLAQALADGLVSDDAERMRMLRSISARATKMADLVSLLFDFVKLESEGFALDRRPIDLSQLLLREAAAAYTDIEDAGMELLVHVPEDVVHINADEAQLSRVVSNLLANAMRHNAPGTIIDLALARRAGVADIVVADSGAPIQQDVDELFEPFARGDAARAGGGSGLGLSIVKGIVDMHGYQIELRQPYGPYAKAFVVTCELDEG